MCAPTRSPASVWPPLQPAASPSPSLATFRLSATSQADQFTQDAVTKRGSVQPGPLDSGNGYPSEYSDSRALRLELCLDQSSGFCLALPPDRNQPVSFPFRPRCRWSWPGHLRNQSVHPAGQDRRAEGRREPAWQALQHGAGRRVHRDRCGRRKLDHLRQLRRPGRPADWLQPHPRQGDQPGSRYHVCLHAPLWKGDAAFRRKLGHLLHRRHRLSQSRHRLPERHCHGRTPRTAAELGRRRSGWLPG